MNPRLEQLIHLQRVESELKRSDSSEARTGRLYIVSRDESDSKASAIPELPARYFCSSDKQIVAAHKPEPYDPAQLLAGRREGHFLVSYEVSSGTPSGWMALKKDLLTEVLGAGLNARIAGLPLDAAQVLRLMCTDLVVPENVS